jgi:hypothetical protein
LFDCEVSVQARHASSIDHQLLPLLNRNVTTQEAVLNFCAAADTDSAGIFAMLVWVLWQNRNDKVWTDTNASGRNLGIKARHLWMKWGCCAAGTTCCKAN